MLKTLLNAVACIALTIKEKIEPKVISKEDLIKKYEASRYKVK